MFYVIANKWQVPLKDILVVTYEDIILTTTDDELLFNTIDKIKKSEPNESRSSDIYIVYGFDIMEHSNLDTPTNIKDYIIYSFDNTYKKDKDNGNK